VEQLTVEQKRLLVVDHERSVLLTDVTADNRADLERYLIATPDDRNAMWSTTSVFVHPLTLSLFGFSDDDLTGLPSSK
jgi:hypothetical protein